MSNYSLQKSASTRTLTLTLRGLLNHSPGRHKDDHVDKEAERLLAESARLREKQQRDKQRDEQRSPKDASFSFFRDTSSALQRCI